MTAKQIAKDGICDFECWNCRLRTACNEHNDRHNDNVTLDQTELRKRFANEYLIITNARKWNGG